MKTFWAVTGIIILTFFSSRAQENLSKSESFSVPLTDGTNLTVEGKYRFLSIDGQTGFQPTSMHTKAYVETQLHHGDKGTILFWFSPMEELNFFPGARGLLNMDPGAFTYPFIADVYPPNHENKIRFGIFWGNGDPQIMGKMSDGGDGNKRNNYKPAYAYIEKIPLYPGHWYNLAMTWDKPKQQLDLYVNGRKMGMNHEAAYFSQVGDKLYIGCPMMAMRDLKITNQVFSVEQLMEHYKQQRTPENDAIDPTLDRLSTPVYGPQSDFRLDSSWEKSYECSFTKEKDLDDWIIQTDEAYLDSIITDITPEGLLFKTSDQILPDGRCTLWGPKLFEGDQCLDVDFRVESDEGLALVMMCASGAGREDFIEDHELEMTGKMNWILGKTRNYHWEFLRRVNVIRRDMESQTVYKNPWMHHLYWGVIPKLEKNKWYKLRMVKTENRLQGTIDNKIVFDVEDDSHNHPGPIFNFGRIALRHMWQTAVRYKNLVVYERKSE